jgi:hypothetical protein
MRIRRVIAFGIPLVSIAPITLMARWLKSDTYYLTLGFVLLFAFTVSVRLLRHRR